MLYEALSFIRNELNEYLKLKFGLNEDKVIISNIINQDGSVAVQEENKIIITIVGIQEEKTIPRGSFYNQGSGGFTGSNPPIYLNIFLLFSNSYTGKLFNEGLKFISFVIAFFQSRNVFSSSQYANMDSGIGKLVFEIENLSFQEQNNLWASMGAKYVPSVLYKVRMLVVDEGLIRAEIPEISEMPEELGRPLPSNQSKEPGNRPVFAPQVPDLNPDNNDNISNDE